MGSAIIIVVVVFNFKNFNLFLFLFLSLFFVCRKTLFCASQTQEVINDEDR